MSAYERELDRFLDEIFSLMKDWTYQKIASKSKLSLGCVYNIEQRVTRLPRFKTIFQLAKAVGLEVRLVGIQKLRVVG